MADAMDRLYEYVRSSVVNFKLTSCCWLAPIRIGVLVIGYFNLIIALTNTLACANDSFSPVLKRVQEKISEEASMTLCVLAYTVELGFSVLLVCGMHRNDVELLQVYMFYSIAAIVMSLVVYAITIANIDVLIKIVIIFSTLFQCYVIVLVRSAIVEIKEAVPYNFTSRFDKHTYKVHINNLHSRTRADVEAQEQPAASNPRTEPETQAQQKSQTLLHSTPQTQTSVLSQPQTNPQSHITPSQIQSDTNSNLTQPQLHTQSVSEPLQQQSHVQTQSQPQPQQQIQAQTEPLKQPQPQQQIPAQTQLQTQPQQQIQAQTQRQTQPQPQQQIQAQTQLQTQPQPQQIQGQTQPQTQPQSQQIQAQTQLQTQPQPQQIQAQTQPQSQLQSQDSELPSEVDSRIQTVAPEPSPGTSQIAENVNPVPERKKKKRDFKKFLKLDNSKDKTPK